MKAAKMTQREFDRVEDKLRANLPKGFDQRFGSELVAFDADMKPTDDIREVAWMYADNYYACLLIRVKDGVMEHCVIDYDEVPPTRDFDPNPGPVF